MVPSAVRQALQIAAALFALAAYTNALRAGDDANAISGREQQLVAAVQEILARDGPYSLLYSNQTRSTVVRSSSRRCEKSAPRRRRSTNCSCRNCR
jgi:hypothetical protein